MPKAQVGANPMGRLSIWHPVVGSTMTVADQLASQGAPHGTVVVADVQTAGRGRQGRRWDAAPGSALLTSWILRIPRVRSDISALSPLVAHAVWRALRRVVPDAPLAMKWPNDVLADGRKVAGILLVARGGVDEHIVIAGIGINLAHAAIPSGVVGASMAEWCPGITSRDVLDSLAAELQGMLDAFLPDGRLNSATRAAIDSCLAWRGERVSVVSDHGGIAGVIAGIDARGSLVLQAADGSVVPVRMGEIVRGPRPVGISQARRPDAQGRASSGHNGGSPSRASATCAMGGPKQEEKRKAATDW